MVVPLEAGHATLDAVGEVVDAIVAEELIIAFAFLALHTKAPAGRVGPNGPDWSVHVFDSTENAASVQPVVAEHWEMQFARLVAETVLRAAPLRLTKHSMI